MSPTYTERGAPGPLGRIGRAVYRGLLRCMPRSFRERHAAEIERTLSETGNGQDAARFGGKATLDLAWGLAAEWGRAVRSFSLADVGRDARIALRGLRRAPGFTLLAVTALALGMGANATVFSLVNEIVLEPLPVRRPERLINVYLDQPGANSFTGFSWPEYRDYRAGASELDGLAALSGIGLRFGEPGSETRISATMVTDNYFEVLGVDAARGRLFAPEEVAVAANVAVVSDGFWRRREGGREDIVGATLRFNDEPFTVIGVLPPGFAGTFIGFPAEVWVPVTLMERLRPGMRLEAREEQPLEMFARLPAGGTLAAADASLDAIAAELEEAYPVLYRDRRVKVFPMTGIDQSMYDGVVGFVGVLLALSGLVLLAACLNVGGMMLARGSYRGREMAVRTALGAPRWRLVRQVLVEALALFALGTAAAILAALQLNALLRRFIEALGLPIAFELRLDPRVLAFTLAVGLTTAVLTALSPALRTSSALPAGALRAGMGQTSGSHRVRGAFLVGQVALSLVLLVIAGLFVRAAWRGARLDTGFDVEALTTTFVGLPAERYDEGAALDLFERFTARLELSPLVEAATFAALPPIDVARNVMSAQVPGFLDQDGDDRRPVDVHAVGRGYFATIGLPLRAGRVFEPADHQVPRRVAIVNRTAAEMFWPERPAPGRVVVLGGEELQVVGVVEDSRTVIQDATPTPLVYVPAGRQAGRRMTVVMRSAADPGALTELVRTEMAAIDAALPPPSASPLAEIIELSLLPQRLAARFAGGLGALALALSVCGVYGIVAYAVGCRRRELGIRVALGGAPAGLVGLMMRSGLLLVGAGVALGVIGLVAVTPLLRDFLLDVSPFDPLALGVSVALMVAIASLASWLPARRAARIDPVIVLKGD